MQARILFRGQPFTVNLAQGINLSASMGMRSKEFKAWFTDDVEISPEQRGDWTASVEKGSPVNFYNIRFNPHGNGTHTETVGHISPSRESVNTHLNKHHFMAKVVWLKPEKRGEDWVVSLAALQSQTQNWEGVEALIIKTGDYPDGHDFSGTNPTYFEWQLLEFVREQGIEHFLCDLPSVDREEDQGALLAHRAFWNYPQDPRTSATISELLQIPAQAKPGLYLLNLQVAPFENDAAPCRPVVFALQGE